MTRRTTGQYMPTWTPACLTQCLPPSNLVGLSAIFSQNFLLTFSVFPDITSSITYNPSAPLVADGTVDEYSDVDDIALVPVTVIAQPPVTQTIELEFLFDTLNDGTNHALINGITYNSPLVPAIFSELSLGPNATTSSAYGPLSFVIDHLDVVDIVIKNADTGKHPLCVSRAF